MQQFIQQIIVALISVVFAKWLDVVWTNKNTSKEYFQSLFQAKLATADNQTLSQFNKKIYLSDWTYYIMTLGMLYGLLTLACGSLYLSTKYFHHSLKQNIISDYILSYGDNIHNVFSIGIIFLLYPLVNLISQIFSNVIILNLKKINLSLTELNIQQIRMQICMGISLLLAALLILYTF